MRFAPASVYDTFCSVKPETVCAALEKMVHAAAREGNMTRFKCFLPETGHRPRLSGPLGCWLLHNAVSAGQILTGRFILEEGVDPNRLTSRFFLRDRSGLSSDSTLHTAVKRGNVDIVWSLLEAGAKVDQLGKISDKTPLAIAAAGRTGG